MRGALGAVAALMASAVAAAAQLPAGVSAGAVAAAIGADPSVGDRTRIETRLLHPVVMLHRPVGRLPLLATVTVNLEGVTLRQGELAPGAWGEGFVDRRHPHTLFHELILTADDLLGAADGAGRLAVTVGKGFVPFGTDDPMQRPFLRFPVNHHLAQILERAVAIVAWRSPWAAAPVALEAAAFNGDEPETPWQWPRIGGRFGDSWAARLTVTPLAGVEVQGSYARVHSPEHRPGAGTTQRKWSASARLDRRFGGVTLYALGEWARTSEAGGFFRFTSALGETAATLGAHRLAYRVERTERPEEERLTSFRSQRPHLDDTVLGITRWTVHTVGYQYSVGPVGGIATRFAPFVELSAGRVAVTEGLAFDPAAFYGRTTFWTVSTGVRVAIGARPHRMGRYGAGGAAAEPAVHSH